MSELKPCPFCGGKAVTNTFFDDDDLECTPLDAIDDCEVNCEVTCENERCINGWWLPPENWNNRPIEDELRKRIAELEAERRWIPVSERLPEVYRDEDGEFIPFLVCENDKDFPYRALYDGLNWGDGMFVADVTHWMPLPEPPIVYGKEREE